MKYLLDTNVFREVGKTVPHEHVQAWLGHVDDADLAISTLTVREVTKGIERLRPKKPEIAAAIEARVDGAYEAFASYTDIVDHCCYAWRKLVDQPWRIMSLGLRTWAHKC